MRSSTEPGMRSSVLPSSTTAPSARNRLHDRTKSSSRQLSITTVWGQDRVPLCPKAAVWTKNCKESGGAVKVFAARHTFFLNFLIFIFFFFFFFFFFFEDGET